MSKVVVLVLCTLIVLGCQNNGDDDIVGGPCTYEYTEGTLHITNIDTTLFDHGMVIDMIYESSDIDLMDKLYLNNECVITSGVSVGDTIVGGKYEIMTGTCAPRHYESNAFDSVSCGEVIW
ncbi:MAG: hypothetical protein OCD01_04160 [Fibrobacterales bacterium]